MKQKLLEVNKKNCIKNATENKKKSLLISLT